MRAPESNERDRPVTTWHERVFVWLGGALFVGSLARTAWLYALTFSDVRPWAGWRPVAADVLLITVFATHHSLFARDRAKNALGHLVPRRLLRSVYVWIASLLLIAVSMVWQRVGGELYRVEGIGVLAFAAVQLLGLRLI